MGYVTKLICAGVQSLTKLKKVDKNMRKIVKKGPFVFFFTVIYSVGYIA